MVNSFSVLYFIPLIKVIEKVILERTEKLIGRLESKSN
jgi:hypothetical protein